MTIMADERPVLNVVFREPAPVRAAVAGTVRPVTSAGAGVRAVHFVRGGEVAGQRDRFAGVCAARGWIAGGVVRDFGSGARGWAAAVRLVVSGRYGVIVVDGRDALSGSEVGRRAALDLAARSGVRVVVAGDRRPVAVAA